VAPGERYCGLSGGERLQLPVNLGEANVMEVIPTGAALGAEVRGVNIRQPLDAATVRQLIDVWHQHLILIIREQPMTDDQHITFTSYFGEPEYPGITKLKNELGIKAPNGIEIRPDSPVVVVSNIKVDGKAIGSLGDGEAAWHTDSSYTETPFAGSFLHAHEIPPNGGGDTYFNNMYEVLESLPKELRQSIEGKTLLHPATHSTNGQAKPGFENITDITTAPGAKHPLIRTHVKTGRKALYLGRRINSYILGMDLGESEALLNALWAQMDQDRFAYRHRWRLGDLVVWDNRCAMHKRDAFDPTTRRRMHRTQTVGDRPS